MTTKIHPLVDFLIEDKLLIEEQFKGLLAERKELDLNFQEILIKERVVSEEQILKSLSNHLGLPYIKITPEEIDGEIVKKVPAKLATHYNFMPLREEEGVFIVAINDPFDVALLDEIRLFLKKI